MGTHAHLNPGDYVTIDTPAWLEQRTGGIDPDLTADLLAWAATSTHPDTHPGTGTGTEYGTSRRDWVVTARAWCTARGHEIPEPDLITHVGSRLDAEVWVLRATTTGRYRVAVVGINHDTPAVYAEDPSLDPGDWFDADSVDITCPAGHGWTWRTGRELLTADGDFTTLTGVFGADLDAPFSPCGNCAAHTLDPHTTPPCGCDGTPWIRCPVCGTRCDVELPTR